LDFGFMDKQPSPAREAGGAEGLYSPFEMVADELGGAAAEVEPAGPINEVMKMMKYERKISASLYALSGVSECLRLRLGDGGGDHAGAGRRELLALSGLRDACRKQQQEEEEVVDEGGNAVGYDESSSSSISNSTSSEAASSSPEAASSPQDAKAAESDMLLWSSLDLPPIC